MYKQSCNKLVVKWLEDYFDAEDFDYTWMDRYGSIFEFADYYINFSTILDCYKYNVTKEQFFDWYDQSVEQTTDLSLPDFILLPEKREEVRQKHLKELEQRVKTAEKELEKEIEKYTCTYYCSGTDTSMRCIHCGKLKYEHNGQ